MVYYKILRTLRINEEPLCHIASLYSQNVDPTAQNQNAVCSPGNQFQSLYAFTSHLRKEIRRPTKWSSGIEHIGMFLVPRRSFLSGNPSVCTLICAAWTGCSLDRCWFDEFTENLGSGSSGWGWNDGQDHFWSRVSLLLFLQFFLRRVQMVGSITNDINFKYQSWWESRGWKYLLIKPPYSLFNCPSLPVLGGRVGGGVMVDWPQAFGKPYIQDWS